MNKERIEIGGVWYVREELPADLSSDDVIEFQGILHETSKYTFEATRFKEGDDPSIEFTDKRYSSGFIKDVWDNIRFFKGILEEDPNSLKSLRTSMCLEGEAHFKSFLRYLKSKDWL